MDRLAQRLPLDVPERNVDGRDGGVDGEPLEVAVAVQHIPVVLDGAGVFAHQVLGKADDGGARGLDVAPRPGLADAVDPFVGIDADEHELTDVQRLDLGDFHCRRIPVVVIGGTKSIRRTLPWFSSCGPSQDPVPEFTRIWSKSPGPTIGF